MWFLILSVLVFNSVAIFMPKNLSRIEIWATCLFAMCLQDNVDIYLDLKLDLYGYFSKGTQWQSLIAILGLYPAANTIFLNYYPFHASAVKKFLYVLTCSLFALVYEFAAVKSGYFYHNGWKYWYSAVCYPVLFYMLVMALKLTRKFVKEAI